jgi:mannose-6-phosphate isomerase-like protein (cupin superfamily)
MSSAEPPQPPFVVVDSSEVEPRWDVMKPIRQAAGITAFGINEYVLPPGWDDYDEHDETKTGHVEMYYCISGSGTMTIDDDEVAFRPGRYVFVRPQCTRNLVAGPEGMRAIAIGVPDSSTFSGWDGL